MARTFFRDALVELFVETTPLPFVDMRFKGPHVNLFVLVQKYDHRKFTHTIRESAKTCPHVLNTTFSFARAVVSFQSFDLIVEPTRFVNGEFQYMTRRGWSQ